MKDIASALQDSMTLEKLWWLSPKVTGFIADLWAKYKNPYPIHYDKHKCIFIHIPKTAGISVSRALFGKGIGHFTVRHFYLHDKNKFRNYYKFAFTRNPWDRIVSSFHFLKKGGVTKHDRAWAHKNLKDYDDFESFVLDLRSKKVAKRVLSWRHFKPQYEYLCIRGTKIAVNYVGSMENIDEDFKKVSNKIGVNSTLGHLNKSKHKSYKDYFNDRTRNIVAKLYKNDIDLFNYKF